MTTIELTEEQRQALRREPGKPLDVVDPATQECYVLIARDQFARAAVESRHGFYTPP
jgi:hypothetical protein